MDKETKLYKLGGSKGHWWLQWTDGGAWKTTSFQYVADLKRLEKILKGQGYKRQTEPEQNTEVEQIHLSVMADKGCLADFLEDLAKCIRSDGEDFKLYETGIGCAEITN